MKVQDNEIVKTKDLASLRKEIDQTDTQLAMLLKTRFEAVAQIARIKEEQGLAIFDENREKEILSKISAAFKDSTVETEILEVFSALLIASKKAQAKLLGR